MQEAACRHRQDGDRPGFCLTLADAGYVTLSLSGSCWLAGWLAGGMDGLMGGNGTVYDRRKNERTAAQHSRRDTARCSPRTSGYLGRWTGRES